MTHRRPNESRARSAGAGATSLATGIAQICWILAKITTAGHIPKPTLHWDSFQHDDYNLFLWEAYVTGKAKTSSHTEDAKAAVEAFICQKPFPLPTPPPNLFSIIGAAILWAGYSQDPNLLHQQTLLIAPKNIPDPNPESTEDMWPWWMDQDERVEMRLQGAGFDRLGKVLSLSARRRGNLAGRRRR